MIKPGNDWVDSEKRDLLDLVRQGATDKEIAAALRRSLSAVQSMKRRLGILNKNFSSSNPGNVKIILLRSPEEMMTAVSKLTGCDSPQEGCDLYRVYKDKGNQSRMTA